MKKSISIILLAVVFNTTNIIAQDEAKEEFTPSGAPIVKIYSNYHYNFTKEEHGFQITRAYLGYKYKLSEEFSTKLILDVADPGNGSKLQQTAFLKNAALTYKKGKIKADFGLISTKYFKVHEKIWGFRYLLKVLQDEYLHSPSADLGADITYKACDMFSIDAFIYNGEGYKKLQGDNTYKGGVGMTINPKKELTIRLVGDMQQKSEINYNLKAFAAYHNEKFKLGAEYVMMMNNSYVADLNMSAMSFFGVYNLNKKYTVFARYDNITSNILSGATDPWNINDNGSAVIGGIQYSPLKNINVSANYRLWMPEDTNVDYTNMVYLNFEYKF